MKNDSGIDFGVLLLQLDVGRHIFDITKNFSE